MATPQAIMDSVAALLNDTAQSLFTDAIQLPYFNIALRELREGMEQHNIAYFNAVENKTVLAGVLGIGGTGQPTLPTNLVEIRELWERTSGSEEEFIPMTRVEYLPPIEVQTTDLIWWTWQDQKVKFIGATSDREVKFNYIVNSLADVVIGGIATDIPVINSESYLQYRTAGLVAQFVGENIERAADLNTMAQLAMDRFLSINIKGKQAMPYRRRPFRAAWKQRSWF